LEEQVNRLAKVFEEQKKIHEEILVKREEFQKNNAALFATHESILEEIGKLKEAISTDAIEKFGNTGEKKLYGGIGIRVMTKLLYEEPVALSWAKEHSLCLKLDSKAFDKIAKTQEIDFVKKEEKVITTFPAEIKIENETNGEDQ